SWIRSFAAGIGTRPAVVILEPDALAGLDCLAAADRQTRLSLLHDAVSALSSHVGVSVYLDAGNAGWHSATEIAGRVQQAGVRASPTAPATVGLPRACGGRTTRSGWRSAPATDAQAPRRSSRRERPVGEPAAPPRPPSAAPSRAGARTRCCSASPAPAGSRAR